jgi:hypothetical protein
MARGSLFRRFRRRLQGSFSALLALAVMAGLIAAVTLVDWTRTADGTERTLDAAAETRPADLSELLVFVRRAMLRPEAPENLNSVEMSGTIRLATTLAPFRSWKKRGNQSRLQFAHGQNREVFLYSGVEERVYHTITAGEQSRTIELEGEAASEFRADASLHFPFLWDAEIVENCRFEGLIRRFGLSYLSLLVQADGAGEERYLISPETGWVVFRERIMRQDGRESLRLSEYGEYRWVEGIRFPHHITTWVDHRYGGDVVISEIQVNPGIFDHVFDVPVMD